MASAANHHSDGHPHNYTMMQAFEWYTPGGGNHWKWLGDNAERFADIGITALWIPPPTKASSGESTGYDVYDLWDIGEFEHPRDKKAGVEPPNRTKYGTRQELEEAMKKLRAKGISIYVDAVLNHKAGADECQLFKAREVDRDNRSKLVTEAYDIEGWTKFTFPGRQGKYSKLEWGFEHFTGVDWDQKGQKSAIFRIEGDGKTWARDVDGEHGNYDYLMASDVDHAHPEVKEDLLNWGAWMMRTFPISGFRFDAVKHMSRGFVCDFVKHVRQEARKMREEQGKEAVDENQGPIAFSVGEFWKDSLDACLKYLGEFGDEQFSLFDAPLHYNFKEAGDAGKDYDLRKVFDGTIVQARPIDAVTLVENHDTQAGQALESTVSPTFKPLAYAIILLRQDGYPCVFLGDLDGCHGDGSNQPPPAPPTSDLSKLIKARKCFAYGEQKDYWDHASCVGWVRVGDVPESHVDTPGAGHDGCAVVLCVGQEEGKKWMEVGKRHAGQVYVDALGWKQGEVKVNQEGWAEFTCHPQSCSVWVSKEAKEKYGF